MGHCASFVAPTLCPVGIVAHNRPAGHTGSCVPGQLTLI